MQEDTNLPLVDFTVPRRSYTLLNCQKCPECGQNLVEEDCMVLFYVKANDNAEEEVYSTNELGSKFCETCPVVVFDQLSVEKATKEISKSKDPMYYIAGIIDIDSIPEDQMEQELGTSENPIPFTAFLPAKNLKTVVVEKKLGSNDPCSCGSGKKYKKCCA